MPNDVFLSLDHGPFLVLSAPTTREDGAKVGRYRKEIIKVGEYVKKADNLRFVITPATLSHWVDTFRAMRENGVKIPVPLVHDENVTLDSESNRGWVDDLFVVDDALVMTCELFDKDVENLVKRNDVSLFSPPEWTDGRGNRYVRPIQHIALTPVPVVPGLGDFVPIAASFGDTKMSVDLKQLGADIGIKEELTAKNAGELILAFCTDLKDQVKTATDKTASLSKELEAAKKKPEPPDKKNPAEVHPTVLRLAHRNRTMQVDALVAGARLTPAVRDKIKARKIGERDGDMAALKLSLEQEHEDDFDFWMEMFAENDPVKLGEQTGAQTKLELSDPNKGIDGDVLVKDAERRAKAAAGV